MPIPRYVDTNGIAFEMVRFCKGSPARQDDENNKRQYCGYAVEDCALTQEWKKCPVCGGALVVTRVNYPGHRDPGKPVRR